MLMPAKLPCFTASAIAAAWFACSSRRSQDVVHDFCTRRDDAGHDLVAGGRHGRRLADDRPVVGGDEDDGVERRDHGRGALIDRRAGGHRARDLQRRLAAAQDGDVAGQRADIAARRLAAGDQRRVGQPLPLAVDVGVQREAALLGLLLLQWHGDLCRAALILRRRQIEERRCGDEARGQLRHAASHRGRVRVRVTGPAGDPRLAAAAAEDGDRR